MASATENDVRQQLPNDIEDQPSSAEIVEKLDDAAQKVGEYDNLTSAEVVDAEKYWAAYLLLDLKYQQPDSITEIDMEVDYGNNPAERLRKKFLDVVGGSIMRVI